MSIGAQLFGIAAVLPSLALILVLVRRGHMRIKYAMLWVPVGLAMLVMSVVPGMLNATARLIGVAYPPTVIFVLAIGLLIFVTVHLSWELSRLDERVRLLAEHLALQSADADPEVALHRAHAPSTPVEADEPAVML